MPVLIHGMRTAFLLLFLWLVMWPVFAQIDWGGYSQTFTDKALDKPSTVGIIIAVRRGNDSFWNQQNNSHAFDGIYNDSAFRHLRPQSIIGRPTFDTAQAHFFLHGVNAKNAVRYQYQVTDYTTSRTIVPWQSVLQLTDFALIRQARLPQMAYLGSYRAPLGHTLVVDVRRTDNQQIVGTAMVAWMPIKPRVTRVYTANNVGAFLRKLQYPWAKDTSQALPSQASGKLVLSATDNNLILLLNATIYTKKQVQYELVGDDKVSNPWRDNEYDNNFIWLTDFLPGSYRLRIRYTAQPQHVTEFRFRVAPAWYQSGAFKLAVALVATVGLGALALLVLLVRQKRKGREEVAKRIKLQLELKAIHAQLNPHFVFNALSSIQGLINRHDVKGANQYLADFARLMRQSLTNANREMIPLDEEIQLLTTYLRLEQLRFGFQFQIALDDTINSYDTDIPALLLQPLVENAVKHGVAQKAEMGLVTVQFCQVEDALIARISDNGNGLTEGSSVSGFGLKLTRDRIRLLNDLTPAQVIELTVSTEQAIGTNATVRFNHWFA